MPKALMKRPSSPHPSSLLLTLPGLYLIDTCSPCHPPRPPGVPPGAVPHGSAARTGPAVALHTSLLFFVFFSPLSFHDKPVAEIHGTRAACLKTFRTKRAKRNANKSVWSGLHSFSFRGGSPIQSPEAPPPPHCPSNPPLPSPLCPLKGLNGHKPPAGQSQLKQQSPGIPDYPENTMQKKQNKLCLGQKLSGLVYAFRK